MTSPWKPPDHEPIVRYVAVQAVPGGGVVGGGVVGGGVVGGGVAARIAARSKGADLLAVHVARNDGLAGADPAQ
ncbi:hypothetical protein AB0C55_31605, partial [Micromonospora humida]|uniref:hypothetical protein n=1 Tax=Micromonospora humida TaxID=2809018 RepID=UPI0033D92F02